jgi:hypothetical protein
MINYWETALIYTPLPPKKRQRRTGWRCVAVVNIEQHRIGPPNIEAQQCPQRGIIDATPGCLIPTDQGDPKKKLKKYDLLS